jgi:hypothetical protein
LSNTPKITTPHKILQKFQETLSNVRHAQTKKYPDKPGKDEFALIKEKQ